ncbi:MAG: glycosyltransferase family 1 protein [Gemmatimonadetes bacterium]|nr:glycosyltransferase family 1 protein [Gemmatimonadota bacterium]
MQIGLGWFPEQPGGLERYFYDLVRRLPDAGVDVEGLVTGSDAVRQAGRTDDGAGAWAVRPFASSRASILRRVYQARQDVTQGLARDDVDLIVSHFALHGLSAIARRRRPPLAVHFHGPWGLESRTAGESGMAVRAKTLLERVVYTGASTFVVLSESFAERLADGFGVPRDRIRVVPGGLDTARYARAESRAEARDLLGWPQGRTIVFAVRRLTQRMGLDDLITAVSMLRREHPELLVLIAGRGPMQAALQRQIADAELSEQVKLLGYVGDDDLPLAYRAAQLSIVPTRALEGFGLVVAESLAAGTPALVAPVGGLPEVVRGLSEQLVLPGVGAAAIAEGLSRVLANPDALPSAAECAAFARAHYDWSIVVARLAAVYAGAVQ